MDGGDDGGEGEFDDGWPVEAKEDWDEDIVVEVGERGKAESATNATRRGN